MVATGLLVALALPWSGTGGTLATPGSALAGETIAAHKAYVVQPGDTLWSIAVRLDPTGDPRPLVAKLAAQNGGVDIVPGEQLTLP
jgi:LysM repeat protein